MEMLDFSAFDALCVKMLATVTACPNVLVDVAFPLLVAKGFERVLAAKLAKPTVETAPPALGVSVEDHAKLLDRKLSVGII